MLIVLVLGGVVGDLFAKRQLSILTSISLLCLLIWGRVSQDLLKSAPPDTAVFLIEFGLVIFLMEANMVVLTFDITHKVIGGKADQLSHALEARLTDWLRTQLSQQGRIAIGCIGISLVLLPLAGLTSISSQELALTGGLLLAAIVALFFLVTYKREPNRR